MNDTFCILPWIHLCVSTDSTAIPCCRFVYPGPHVDADQLKGNGLDALNSPDFNEIRTAMLKGEKVKGCYKCYVDEAANLETYRMESNEQYLKKIGSIDKLTPKFHSLRYIEMSLDNVCNLQCRMCSSKYSTKLIMRDQELNKRWSSYELPQRNLLETDYSYLDKEDLSNLEDIKLLGGEPFMSPNFNRFVDFIDQRTNLGKVALTIATNGTCQLTPALKDRLSKFKRIMLIVSMDAFDRCNDYQRYGSSYQEVWDNAMTYRESLSNTNLLFHTVVSMYTANKLDVTFNAIENSGASYTFDFVRHQEMSVDSAPDDYAEWLLTKNNLNSKAKTAIAENLKGREFHPAKWKMFLEVTKHLDRFYGISLGDYNPELYDFLKANYNYDKI